MMRKVGHSIGLTALVVMLLSAPLAVAQSFTSVDVPERLCAGSSFGITFGFAPTSVVLVEASVARLNHAETVFLPDGVPCGTWGCSYRSPVSFTDFGAGAVITSVDDIRYVRLNMEHSFVKDLYINITCPNGQRATLMRFGGKNNSQCSGSIPGDAEGWLSGDNVSGRAVFGVPNNNSNADQPCNPSASGNGPGTGWNYCWSNNTSEGYTYASGDGIVYRSGHVHGGRIDSSDVAVGSNFYHPDQSLGALVGCPLNGDWYIEVVDGYRQDNGYIFDWEMALNPILLPDSCELTGRGVDGPYVTMVSDSLFLFDVPVGLTVDTTVELRLWMANSCGDTVDTVVSVTLSPVAAAADTVEAVGEYVFNGQTFTTDTTVNYTVTGANGCDSTVALTIIILHDIYVSFDTVVCDPQYPIDWRGCRFVGPGEAHLTLQTADGVDSNVTLTLVEAWSVDTAVAAGICQGESYLLGDTLLFEAGYYERTMQTSMGCDSTVRLSLEVHPTYDSLTEDTTCATEGYLFEGELLTVAGEYSRTYPTLHGCDSTLRLRLEVKGLGLKAVARAVPAVVTEERPELRLTDASRGAEARLWMLMDKEYTDKNLYITYPVAEDSLPVTLVAYGSEQCTDTHRVVVRIDRSALAVPNVFTPDAEQNNRWRIEQRDVLSMQVWIYNRQGLLVAVLDGVDAAWDGNSDGKACPQGAYAFKAQYTTLAYPERIQTLEGTILLIR